MLYGRLGFALCSLAVAALHRPNFHNRVAPQMISRDQIYAYDA